MTLYRWLIAPLLLGDLLAGWLALLTLLATH